MIPSQSNIKDHPRGWTPINHLLPYGIRGSDRAESEVKTEDGSDQSVLNQPDSSRSGLKRRFPEMTHNYRPMVQDQLTSNSLKRLRVEHRAETEPVAPSINVAFSNPFASSRPQSMAPMRVAIPSTIRRNADVAPMLQARVPNMQSPSFDGPGESEADDIPQVASDVADQAVPVPVKSKITTLRTGKKLPVAQIGDWSSSSSDEEENGGPHNSEQLKRNASNARRRARCTRNQVMQNVSDVKFEAALAAPKRYTSSELIDTKPQFSRGKRRVHEDGYSMTPNAIDYRMRKTKEREFEQQLRTMIDQDIVSQVEAEGWLTPNGRLFKAGIRMVERAQQERKTSAERKALTTTTRLSDPTTPAPQDPGINDVPARLRKLADDREALQASIARIGQIVAQHKAI